MSEMKRCSKCGMECIMNIHSYDGKPNRRGDIRKLNKLVKDYNQRRRVTNP